MLFLPAVASAQQTPVPAVITPPAWVRSPQPEFPSEAAAAGAREGSVIVNCEVSAEGVPTACAAIEETPPGVGFGESAIAAALESRLSPRRVNGEPVSGQLRFTIRYRIPDPAPASPT